MKRVLQSAIFSAILLGLTTNQMYSQHYSKFNINNISTFIYNDGQADQNPNGNSGMTFPIFGGRQIVFQTGVFLSLITNGEIKAAGSDYRSGLLPGRILESGEAEDSNLDNVRVFRVKKDQYYYNPIDVTNEMADERKTKIEILNQYEKDWNEWRGNVGAPYTDMDENGFYDKYVDVPGVPGADQTLWFVANDLDTAVSRNYLDANPSGIEMQGTTWGYKTEGWLGSTVFKKYVLINKSSDTWDSVYISYWSDVEIGNAQDDFIGCDTTMNLIFGYNGRSTDAEYGDNSPAMGALLLQGPIIGGTLNDEAIYDGKLLPGKKNLEMTTFHYFYKGLPNFSDFPHGEGSRGNIKAYRYSRGLDENGNPVYEPEQFGGERTLFPFSGDPVTSTGWIDGIERPAGDRRMAMASGPFTMEPGATQVVVYAQIGAFGNNNIHAVRVLKEYAAQVKGFYLNYSGLVTENHEFTYTVPDEFLLHQNYPNPFNPTTTIRFDLPKQSHVNLTVYDLLGREAATLINREMSAGSHQIEFNGRELASGMYVYRLRAGDMVHTKKMILMK